MELRVDDCGELTGDLFLAIDQRMVQRIDKLIQCLFEWPVIPIAVGGLDQEVEVRLHELQREARRQGGLALEELASSSARR